jgi:hypothetical protein
MVSAKDQGCTQNFHGLSLYPNVLWASQAQTIIIVFLTSRDELLSHQTENASSVNLSADDETCANSG